jgi:hypothetical protein
MASRVCHQKRQLTGLLGRLTALSWAASEGHTLVVERLIAAGAALDVKDSDGYGPCADRIGCTLCNPIADVSAGSLCSSWPR